MTYGFAGHDPPAILLTTEQQIRGGDRAADRILIVMGYDDAAIEAIATAEIDTTALQALGASPQSLQGRFTLSYAALPSDNG